MSARVKREPSSAEVGLEPSLKSIGAGSGAQRRQEPYLSLGSSPGHTPGTAVAPILKEVASLAQAGCATPLHQLAVRASLTPR